MFVLASGRSARAVAQKCLLDSVAAAGAAILLIGGVVTTYFWVPPLHSLALRPSVGDVVLHAEGIRKTVADLCFPTLGSDLTVTKSVGIAKAVIEEIYSRIFVAKPTDHCSWQTLVGEIGCGTLTVSGLE